MSTTPIKQDKVEIAIMVPMTGPYGSQGAKIAELIKFGISEKLDGFISTTTYDVATEDYIKQAVPKLIKKNTKVILGPVFSQSVQQLTPFVKANNMIMITFSNNPTLGSDGNIYVFGHASLKQLAQLINFTASKSYQDYLIMTPSLRQAANLNKALQEMVVSNGGKVLAVEEYGLDADSIGKSLDKISSKVDALLEDADSVSKPVLILVEEDKERLAVICEYIKNHNLDSKAIIIGDNRIDSDSCGQCAYLFTGSEIQDPKLQNFALKEFGASKVNFIENLAYDLGSITAISVGKDYSRETFLNRFTSPVWYKGVSGEFRFINSVAERKYSIIEHSEFGYKRVD